jgi:hypothetical protein
MTRMRKWEELGEHQPAELADLRNEVEQLRTALETRIVIEQAKGVLAERYGLSVNDAFLLLRGSARSVRTDIHTLADDVVRSRETPPAIRRGIARNSRLRAVARRERGELAAEQTHAVQARYAGQRERLNQWTDKPTARIRTSSRSDAVDLASRLRGYRWYLIVPDNKHWEVVVEYAGASHELHARVDEWMNARSIPSVHVRLGDTETTLHAP